MTSGPASVAPKCQAPPCLPGRLWHGICSIIRKSGFNTVKRVFIKNVVAVAAYSRLASRSQAKFQTMKLSPLSTPCAAAPAQSTVSTCRPLRFSPRSCTDVNLTRTVPEAFPRHFRSKKRSQLVAAYLACQSVAGVGVFPRHI